MAVDLEREEFRKYLQDSGAVTALSNVFMKLYELKNLRPKAAIIFIHDHLLDELPSLTEYENLQAELKATTAILEDLKNNGQLNASQLAMINNTASSKPGQVNIGAFIGARQSQIVNGNINKTSHKNQSRIRQKNKNDADYTTEMRNEVTSLVNNKNCKSLLRNHITEQLFDQLIILKTPSFGSDLIDCISSGLEIHESMVGVYAADGEAYETFKDLFYPIIKEYHDGYDCGTGTHPPIDWGDPTKLTDLDPTKQYITSTRIRCIRTVENHKFIPQMDKTELNDLNVKIKAVVNTLNLGTWYDLENMDVDTKKDMIKKRLILEFGDRFLEAAGATNHWPTGRAVSKSTERYKS